METIGNISSKLNLLIDAYFKSSIWSKNTLLAIDIIEIISAYYGHTQIAYLATIRWKSHSSKIMKLIDIDTKQSYQTNLYFTTKQNGFSPVYDHGFQSHCVAQKCLLPLCMKSAAQTKYQNTLTSNELLSSKQWNLIFRFGRVSHVTALHPSFYRRSVNFEPTYYRGYNFNIPTMKLLSVSSTVYNQTDTYLYSLYARCIHRMTLNANSLYDIKKYSNICKWEKWHDYINDNIYINNGASVCMVDNDKFIACFNATGLKSYLFALNSTKLVIPLADACVPRYRAVSMYHHIFHKIITVGVKSAECYDINKDKSMLISQYEGTAVESSNIWCSKIKDCKRGKECNRWFPNGYFLH
eukprot:482294_1